MRLRGAAPRAAVLVALACALVVLAGCGSSAKPLSKADFIAKADGICQKYTTLSAESTKDLKNPSPDQVIQAIRTRLLPLFEQQDKDLAKLHPPTADKAVVAKFLKDLAAATQDMGINTKAFVAAHGLSQLFAKASLEARNYGLKVCAKTGSG